MKLLWDSSRKNDTHPWVITLLTYQKKNDNMSLRDMTPDIISGDVQMENGAELKSFLPLTEATFFILLILSPGRKHGYAIMKDVSQMSSGRIVFSTGTLYGALKRLLDQGWIVRLGEGDDSREETTRSRKEYELTSLGRNILSAETARMQQLVKLAVSIQHNGT